MGQKHKDAKPPVLGGWQIQEGEGIHEGDAITRGGVSMPVCESKPLIYKQPPTVSNLLFISNF